MAAAVVALTVAGAVLRIVVAHQSLFADELSTYWIVTRHSLGGVLSLLYSTGRIQHAEITPPLSFVASWITTRLGDSPELVRLPALVAGTATIPLVYRLGQETVGRRAGLVGAALTAFSPFMIYYSAEGRGYGMLMFFVAAAVLWMLRAARTNERRSWILYAVCTAAAFWTHYMSVFVLGPAALWLLWTHPAVRRPALLANLGAGLLYLPWLPGLIADTQSPTLRITAAITAFTPDAVRLDLEHWSLGYPYSIIGLRRLPGTLALVLLALAAVLAAGGLIVRVRRRGRSTPSNLLVLVFLLAAATPVGESLYSAVVSHIIGTRYLAPSWPFLALFSAAVALAAGRRLGVAVAGLAVVAFALGAIKMVEPAFQRPDYQSAADYVTRHARPGSVVVDVTGVLSPGPLSGFDAAYHGSLPVVRSRFPAERDHPFTVFDPRQSDATAVREAVRLAAGRPIYVVVPQLTSPIPGRPVPLNFPAQYHLRAVRSFPGIQPTLVGVFAASGP